MKIFDKNSEKFLFSYLNANSPTGFEAPGQKLWVDYMKPYVDTWQLDHYGTAYGIINPEHSYKVVIEAHADEISWFVNYISDQGFIYVIRNGGSDHSIAPSMRVDIHTQKGKVKGVFGWPAIHTRKGKDEHLAPTMENIFIDVGAKNKKEILDMGIHVGCVVTFEDELIKLNKNYYVGRALDNRLGGFCIAQVTRMLSEQGVKLPFGLYVVNSVQEEIGLRGAEMIANTIKPNVALVTDVTHDSSTPLVNNKIEGDIKCGEGPSLTYAPAVHQTLLQKIITVAEENKIPFQRSASSRSTGTDTDAFAYSNGGIPSALISIPLRYMHTTVEMAHKDDIEHVVKLIYHTILSLRPDQSYRYFT